MKKITIYVTLIALVSIFSLKTIVDQNLNPEINKFVFEWTGYQARIASYNGFIITGPLGGDSNDYVYKGVSCNLEDYNARFNTIEKYSQFDSSYYWGHRIYVNGKCIPGHPFYEGDNAHKWSDDAIDIARGK